MSKLSAEERAALLERRNRLEQAEREEQSRKARALPFYGLNTRPPLAHALRAVTEGRNPQVIWDAWAAAGFPRPDVFEYPKAEITERCDD